MDDHLRLAAYNTAMPSLCLLLGVEVLVSAGGLQGEELCFSFGHSGIWVGKHVPASKISYLAFALPRWKPLTPSVFACQIVGVGRRT